MKIRWYKYAVKNLLSAIEYLENNNAKDYSEQLLDYSSNYINGYSNFKN